MSNYDLLKQKIQKKIPKLCEMSRGQIFTIKNMPFSYEFLHFIYNYESEIVEVATLYNDEVDVFDFEYFTNQHITIVGKDPMLHDVLEWLKILSQEMYGENDLRLYNDYIVHFLGTWDFSSPYLKDQKIVMCDRLIVLYDGAS